MAGGGEEAARRCRHHDLVPLAALIGREMKTEKMERPCVRFGLAAQSKKGEDYFLVKTDCQRVHGNPSSTFSVFAVFDGHNGNAAAIFTRENLLNDVLGAIPRGLSRDEWLQALPRALVAGFVKTDKVFQSRGETSGTTATFVIVDGWTITVASVGDSRCILDAQGGVVSLLTVDHRLEENAEERARVMASGGEVGRLSIVGGAGIGPLRCWPGGLCLSRSTGDMDVGEFIVPVPYVKQVKISNTGGRLIIASDGIWDALPSEMAAKSCRGLPAELAAVQVVKEALRTRGLKDDTTCIVVDIIRPDNSVVPPPSPPKKMSKFKSFFRRRSRDSASKLAKKLSSVGIVEEIFEEGSAMLSERYGAVESCNRNTPMSDDEDESRTTWFTVGERIGASLAMHGREEGGSWLLKHKERDVGWSPPAQEEGCREDLLVLVAGGCREDLLVLLAGACREGEGKICSCCCW